MTALLDHVEARGSAGDPSGQLLRYRNGNPITHRRYDHLWVRLGRYLPWITTLNVSAHWVRHTTLTWVERNFGFAIVHASHFDDADTKNATMTYVKANTGVNAIACVAHLDRPAGPRGGGAVRGGGRTRRGAVGVRERVRREPRRAGLRRRRRLRPGAGR